MNEEYTQNERIRSSARFSVVTNKWNIFHLEFLYLLQYSVSILKGLNLYFNSIQSILNFFNYYSMALITRNKDRSERRCSSIRFRVWSDAVYSQFERCSCLGCSCDVGQFAVRCSWELSDDWVWVFQMTRNLHMPHAKNSISFIA